MAARQQVISASSPNQLQGKLNLPGRSLGRSNQTCVSNWVSTRIKYISVIERWRQVRPIENVKKLRPKLHVEVFRDCLDPVVLKNRKVKIQQARTNQRVPA